MAKFTNALVEHLKTMDPSTIDFSFPEPTVTFDTTLDLEVGGRKLELLATPGGETTDSLVVWLPEDRMLFTGNLFGPLFGLVPNLITIRGDRYRDPLLYIESLNAVLAFGPQRLITGHFDPIEGADRIADEVTAMRDAMQCRPRPHHRSAWRPARTSTPRCVRSQLPEHLDIGEGYGKTSWNVRAIWEMYAGWFHHRSTTELYSVAPAPIAADVVAAAGADALAEAARAHLAAGRPVQALHLTDLVLAVDPANRGRARSPSTRTRHCLADTENFWEQGVAHQIDQRTEGNIVT